MIDEVQLELLDEERDWLTAFRALALVDSGRADEAARDALQALAGHLTQYAGVVRRYAAAGARSQ